MPLTRPIDADFARGVLADLYTYRRKRMALARLLWLFLGIFGGHRFYVGRTGTALLMLLTGGGALIWWVIDGFFVRRMVERHNTEQERRRAAGEPPLELEFMPALSDEVLRSPPAWTHRWRDRGRTARTARFTGDLLVLAIAGLALGALSGTDGVEEAIVAILAILAVTAAGGSTAGIERVPLAGSLVKWSHRVRLFYYYNEPRSPLGLLLRPLLGILLAPFRRRDRAEVRLYLQLGFVFTLAFMALDLIPRLFERGLAALGPGTLFDIWVREAAVTFLVIYAFAAPIGAVLTLYLLTRRTHVLPRALCVFTLAAILLGMLLR